MKNTLLVGTNKGLLIFKHENGGWQCIHEAHTAIPVSYATVDPRDGTMWACLDHGHWGQKLQRSRDGGITWEEVAAPAYPADATFQDKPATLSYQWYLKPGAADQPGRLYLGTEPAGLFRSDDGGNSWALVESLWNHPHRQMGWFGGGRDLPGVCSIMIDPRDSQHLVIGISVGGVYESCDGGETWQSYHKGMIADYMPDPEPEVGHDPHFIVASPDNPDVLWQQNHCGVFRSTDSGHTWQNISQGIVRFGFAIAVEDQNTAWVIPAIKDEFRIPIDRALAVCRTEDGGKTWQDLRQGLPQKHCYDLAYRHALDLDAGRLAFGTTTGNLFFSDNRGDHWQTLSHHLPPVYSVRFAD